MTRLHKLELALARTKQAQKHLRLAGCHGDGIEFDDAMQCLSRTRARLETMYEAQKRYLRNEREAETVCG